MSDHYDESPLGTTDNQIEVAGESLQAFRNGAIWTRRLNSPPAGVTASASRPLFHVWHEVARRSGIGLPQAYRFARRAEIAALIPNGIGLFEPIINLSEVESYLIDAAKAASWSHSWCEANLDFLRVAANEAERVLAIADAAYGQSTTADQAEPAPYMDSQHPRYSPKLAAAVSAWLAVGDEGRGTPKQRMEKWLGANADRFGPTGKGSKLSAQGIDECASVANWHLRGGAPKTPGG